MKVVVNASPGLAAALSDPSDNSPGRSLVLEVLEASGSELKEMHPGHQDPTLASWFFAEVNADGAAELAQTLAGVDGIDAAYVEPDATFP